jgi:hypothetical protein
LGVEEECTLAWDVKGISDAFLHAAEMHEARVQEVKLKALKSSGYQYDHDEHLAEFAVYNRLHGRTFLESREALLAELREMRRNPPPPLTPIYHGEHFEEVYYQRIETLINAYSAEAD